MATNEQLKEALSVAFGSKVKILIAFGEVTVEVATSDVYQICEKLKDQAEFQFQQLIDLCAVDYLKYGIDQWETDESTARGFSRGVANHLRPDSTPWQKPRFAVVYHLLSLKKNQRLRVKTFLDESVPIVQSVCDIWTSANWYEREAFDLFGILFEGHPDLRRILSDYGFIGHPFRKDFPLIGEVEMRYDATEGRVVYEPVSIEPRTLVPKTIRKDARYLSEQTVQSDGGQDG